MIIGIFDLGLIEDLRTYICFEIFPLTCLHEGLTGLFGFLMIIMSGKFDLDLIEVIRTYICFGIYPLTYLHEALTGYTGLAQLTCLSAVHGWAWEGFGFEHFKLDHDFASLNFVFTTFCFKQRIRFGCSGNEISSV